MRTLLSATAMTVVFLALDATWLTQTGDRLYRPALGPILAERPNLPAAVAFYVVYLGGVFGLAVRPALKTGRLLQAIVTGAALGFVAYATYDLTNQATLKLWSTTVTVCDLAWGTFVTAVAAGAGFLAGRRRA